MKNITILGAGLVGSLLAIYLSDRGYKVEVYERRPDPRKKGYIGGRSINLALSDRGWQALAKAGIDAKIREIAIPMNGRMMHDVQGNLTFQAYGKDGQAIYSVSRALLNIELINYAENQSDVRFYFNQKCIEVDLENKVITLENTENGLTGQQSATEGEIYSITADFIFGSDGAFSPIRLAMQKTDRFNYSQTYLDYGYKELTIPAAADGSHRLEKNALHIWPRGNFMLIALPNTDGSFTCTLFLPYKGEPSFESVKTDKEAISFFQTYFPDIIPHIADVTEDFFTNPTSSLVMVKANPWIYKAEVALIGDAAHAIVPFYGQGMNAGFEDCYVLNEILEKNMDIWETSLQEYQESRLPDADAICELALNNFVEMRDLVGDPKFLLRKKIEAKINELYPEKWIPLYSMVTFSPKSGVPPMRYSEALAMGKKQDKIMAEIMQRPDIEATWQNLDFEEIVRKLVE
ncbi:MAG: FAD-dependent monooxygenase [Cytophagales bacterium]|nr:MAG: FAD-dependent monooxygenase [Cytophagales bacterium]